MKNFFKKVTIPAAILWSAVAGQPQSYVSNPLDTRQVPVPNQKQEILTNYKQGNSYKQADLPTSPPSQDPYRVYSGSSSVSVAVSGTFTTVTTSGYAIVSEPELLQAMPDNEFQKSNYGYPELIDLKKDYLPHSSDHGKSI